MTCSAGGQLALSHLIRASHLRSNICFTPIDRDLTKLITRKVVMPHRRLCDVRVGDSIMHHDWKRVYTLWGLTV